MALNTDERQQVVYFTGFEVEHTACHGMHTLFVVGTPPLKEIIETAVLHDVGQIYFGTSQSFDGQAIGEWNHRIFGCLGVGYWVTLDYDIAFHNLILEQNYNKHEKFISMISCKLPNIDGLNHNAVLKIDDTTWGLTNAGVWTHNLKMLKSLHAFTHWDQYTQDNEI